MCNSRLANPTPRALRSRVPSLQPRRTPSCGASEDGCSAQSDDGAIDQVCVLDLFHRALSGAVHAQDSLVLDGDDTHGRDVTHFTHPPRGNDHHV